MHVMERSLNSLLLPPLFLLTWLIPSMLFVVFSTASMAMGTAICAVAWIAVGAATSGAPFDWTRRLWRHLGIALSAVALLFIHGVVVDLWFGGVEFSRLIGSSLVLLLMLLGAYSVAEELLTAPSALLASTARVAFIVLTIFGIGAVAGLPSLGSNTFAKPVIVFSEPSHFSFAYLPVFIFTVAVAKRRHQFLLLGLGFILAAALPSLTLLVGVLGASFLVLRSSRLLLLLGIVASAAALLALDLSYYTSRLALSSDSQNLSALVFLQGWQRAYLNITETWGLGIGFQQFGYVGSLGELSRRIVQLMGAPLNLYDGGSTGSKLIAELGAVGVALIAIYLGLVVRGFRLIRKAQLVPIEQRDVRTIFVYSLIIAYGSELLLRGTGYLSASGFFILAALIAVPRLTASGARSFDSGIDPKVGLTVSPVK